MHVTAHPSLARLTTLRLGGQGLALVRLDDERDMEALPETLSRLGGTPVVVGRGSNILARDGIWPLVLIHPHCKNEPQITLLPNHGSQNSDLSVKKEPPFSPDITREGFLSEPSGENTSRVWVRVGAGVGLPRLLSWCAKKGLSGLEGLAGIPGHVGGAVAMNAGSYGCEIGDSLVALRVFSPVWGFKELSREQVLPEYRGLTLVGHEGWFIITEAVLSLQTAVRDNIVSNMRRTMLQKEATQPVHALSAGCVFANPAGQSAGKILDMLGFKGKGLGGVRFSEMHANFLINEGKGSATAALDLIEQAKMAVLTATGIELRMEVKVWPC